MYPRLWVPQLRAHILRNFGWNTILLLVLLALYLLLPQIVAMGHGFPRGSGPMETLAAMFTFLALVTPFSALAAIPTTVAFASLAPLLLIVAGTPQLLAISAPATLPPIPTAVAFAGLAPFFFIEARPPQALAIAPGLNLLENPRQARCGRRVRNGPSDQGTFPARQAKC